MKMHEGAFSVPGFAAVAVWMASLGVGCVAPPSAAPEVASLRYGTVMMEAGQRLQLAGEAAVAENWPLAAYQIHEIEELWEEDLVRARRPGGVDEAVLVAMQDAMVASVIEPLHEAAVAGDGARFGDAWKDLARACNQCHATHGVPFVQVPTEPGHPIPTREP